MALSLKARNSKYNARKIQIDGFIFDSEIEAMRYQELRYLLAGGQISQLRVHPSYSIDVNDHRIGVVELDFEYRDLEKNKYIFEDVKGIDTALSRIKRKLFTALYGADVRVLRKNEIRGAK